MIRALCGGCVALGLSLIGGGVLAQMPGGPQPGRGGQNQGPPGRGESAPSVAYAATAEANFLAGEKAFEDEQYFAAQRFFSYIRTKFPYSRFAQLAQLRIADCQFERKRFLECIDSYQNFARLHPTHEKAAYARFRVGLSYFNQIPSNFFMLPPAHEKDQTAVRDAEQALAAYLDQHPDDMHATEAHKIIDDVRARLMAHERYVADFYKRLGRDRAYAGRLEIIRAKFADVGLTDELLFELVEVWARVGEADKATNAATQLKEKFPKSERVAEADKLLAQMPAPAKPVETPPAEPAPDTPAG